MFSWIRDPDVSETDVGGTLHLSAKKAVYTSFP